MSTKLPDLVPGEKVRHRARFAAANGEVSPWCAKTPRAIDLTKATWTNRDEAVTCRACIAAKARAAGDGK